MISFKQFIIEFVSMKGGGEPHPNQITYVERETSPESKKVGTDFYLAHTHSGHIYAWKDKTRPPIRGQVLIPSQHELFWSPEDEHK
jgi:hypothetical protein